MNQNTLEELPITAGLASELEHVAGSARRRTLAWLGGVVPAVWAIAFSFALTDNSTLVGAAEIATAIAAFTVVGILAAVAIWTRRIGRAPYIVRERGRFYVGGVFRASVSGDKTRRSIRATFGELRMDGVDNDQRLAGVWSALAHHAETQLLEIDYTPNRYLLCVRRTGGDTLWARDGYVAPASPAHPSAPPRPRSLPRLAAIWPLPTAAVLLAIALGSLYAFASEQLGSQMSTIFGASFFVATIGALVVLVIGAYRAFTGLGERVLRVLTGRTR